MVKQGGHKQRRLGQAEKLPARSRSHVESPLALLLLKMWSTGELSGPALQEIAKAAADSGCQGQDIQRLAMLGAAGNSPQNIQRDLMALHFKDMKVPQVHTVETRDQNLGKGWGRSNSLTVPAAPASPPRMDELGVHCRHMAAKYTRRLMAG